MNNYNTIQNNHNKVPCGWHNCNQQCRPNLSVRFKKIPKCNLHKQNLYSVHDIYKKFSSLTKSLYKHLSDPIEINKKIKILKLIEDSLKCEIEIRINQTQFIKPMYRDFGHLLYIENLLNNLKNVQKFLMEYSEYRNNTKF